MYLTSGTYLKNKHTQHVACNIYLLGQLFCKKLMYKRSRDLPVYCSETNSYVLFTGT